MITLEGLTRGSTGKLFEYIREVQEPADDKEYRVYEELQKPMQGHRVIIGLLWLREVNRLIDWAMGSAKVAKDIRVLKKADFDEIDDSPIYAYYTNQYPFREHTWINFQLCLKSFSEDLNVTSHI